jgi:hypothetical protein
MVKEPGGRCSQIKIRHKLVQQNNFIRKKEWKMILNTLYERMA